MGELSTEESVGMVKMLGMLYSLIYLEGRECTHEMERTYIVNLQFKTGDK